MTGDYDGSPHAKSHFRVLNWKAVKTSKYVTVPSVILPNSGSGVSDTVSNIIPPDSRAGRIGISAERWMDSFKNASLRNQLNTNVFAKDKPIATWAPEYFSMGIVTVALKPNVKMARRRISLDAPRAINA
tara:strand:- start:54 stop:443 length:390 start_codon:yes stop_codon:yes gene_type:complete